MHQALQGFAGRCKTRMSKGFSLPCLAQCCTVLRSQWCQSGVNSGSAIPDSLAGRRSNISCFLAIAARSTKIPHAALVTISMVVHTAVLTSIVVRPATEPEDPLFSCRTPPTDNYRALGFLRHALILYGVPYSSNHRVLSVSQVLDYVLSIAVVIAVDPLARRWALWMNRGVTVSDAAMLYSQYGDGSISLHTAIAVVC
jgi:hypothetical protein